MTTGLSRREFGALGIAAGIAGLTSGASGVIAATPALTHDPIGYLDPELQVPARLLMQRGRPPFSDANIAAIRQASAAAAQPPSPDVPVVERRIPGAAGMPPVTVHVVNATGAGSRPGILHMHAGGHVLGSARSELRYLQALARELDCILVTVEYRLAPETRYTGSTEDNYAALRWMHGAADELGLDRARIALLGESAGGGHAALLAIAARDRGEVPVAFQALVYPMLDDRTGSAGSTRQAPPFRGRILWDAAANRYGWGAFLGVEPGGPAVPAAAVPARTVRLEGLPPTFIGVGGADLFLDEDIDYARRLSDAGVPTELLVVPRAFHAFDRIAPDTAISRRFTRAKMDALRRAFGQPVPD
jgi:acetyl esterase/lipase